jgi:hypothetical protein
MVKVQDGSFQKVSPGQVTAAAGPTGCTSAVEGLKTHGRLAEEIDVKWRDEQELKDLIHQSKLPLGISNPHDELKRLRGTYLSLKRDQAADGHRKLLNRINALACLVELHARQRGRPNDLQVSRVSVAWGSLPVYVLLENCDGCATLVRMESP